MRFCLRLSIILGGAGALAAAALPGPLREGGGLWEVSRSSAGAGGERRCARDTAKLAQWEHWGKQCTRVVISSTETGAVIHYTCADGGFGHSQVRVMTPRSLRIDTQGISGGLPFAYVLHARRVGNCPVH